MASFGKPVLSYFDTLLRESDIEILDGPYWLNDNIISFYMQYLEHDVYKNHRDKVAFIGAEVVQLIKSASSDELTMCLADLTLHNKDIIFFPINDCSITSSGGSHWSLLVFLRHHQQFKHFDSSQGGPNLKEAIRVARNIEPLLYINEQGYSIDKKCVLVEGGCAQQKNSYDCGIYVLCFVNCLCSTYIDGADSENSLLEISPAQVTHKRRELKALVRRLQQFHEVGES